MNKKLVLEWLSTVRINPNTKYSNFTYGLERAYEQVRRLWLAFTQTREGGRG